VASPRGKAQVAPLRAALLADPVAFLSAEHARQTVLLSHLERIVRAPRARGARALAAALFEWLTRDLPIHIADEEASLYPRLQAHDSDGVLVQLRHEHQRDRVAVQAVVAGLRRVMAGVAPEPGFAEAAAAFVQGHRSHLALEEAAVTPLAERVLAPEVVAALAAEMAARRGY